MKKANLSSTHKIIFFVIITFLILIPVIRIIRRYNPTPPPPIQETSVTITDKGFIPNEITIHRWQDTRILVKNSEGRHNFVLEKYGIKTDTLRPGESTYVYFYASAPYEYPGGYRFYSETGDGEEIKFTGLLNVL